MSTGSVSFYITSKFRFAKRMIRHRLERQPRSCPYCGPSSPVHLLRRKKFIMDILECGTCRLVFRWPMDTPQEHDVHYHDAFAIDAPQIALPGPEKCNLGRIDGKFVMIVNVMLLWSIHRPSENQATGPTLKDIHNEFFAPEQMHRRRRSAIGARSRLPLQAMTNHSLGKTKFRSYVKTDTSGGHLRLLPAHRRRLYLSRFFTRQVSP